MGAGDPHCYAGRLDPREQIGAGDRLALALAGWARARLARPRSAIAPRVTSTRLVAPIESPAGSGASSSAVPSSAITSPPRRDDRRQSHCQHRADARSLVVMLDRRFDDRAMLDQGGPRPSPMPAS